MSLLESGPLENELPEVAALDTSAQEPKPAPEAPPAPPPIKQRIEYLTALRFPLSHPEWVKNVLLLGICWLIPVLATPLLFGYLYEITEMLHRRQAAPYPLFTFRRFSIYITRGIWGYLLGNMMGAILGPVIQFTFQGTWFGSIFGMRANQEMATIVLAVVIPLVIIGLICLVVALGVVVMPLFLRAGLTQDFALTFNFRFVKDFLHRVWLEALLVNLFTFLATIVLLPLGCALFCYGALAALAYLMIVSAHFNFQLYELYLARGGQPIPLKPLPADVPPVAIT